MFFIVALQALWASSIPMGKILLSYMSSVTLTSARMLIAGSVLLIYEKFFSKQQFCLHKKHLFMYGQIIFFGIYLKYILRYWGLARLSTAKMSFMLNLTPFCIALLSYFFLKEKLTQKKWVGLFLGFVGIIPIICISNEISHLGKDLCWFSWAELAILAEILAHSYAIIVMRNMVRNGYSASMTNGIRMFGGGFLALITALCMQESFVVAEPLTCVSWLAAIIIISNIVCHNLYIYLLKYYSATFLAFTDFLSPLFVACYGWLFLRETITWHYAVSALLVFVGLSLFYADEFQTSEAAIVTSYIPVRLLQVKNIFLQPFKLKKELEQ